MNCTDCKEKLTELLEGLLPETQRQTIEEHLKDCQVCRAEFKELKDLGQRLTSDSRTFRQTNLEDAVFNRIIRQQNEKLKQADTLNRQSKIWRQIMNSKITKLSAAAVIIIAVMIGINQLGGSIDIVTPAYAIEQTIEACHSVRYLHIKSFDAVHDEPKEFWFECDEFGQIKNARWHMPEWDSPADGAKVVVWKGGKAQVWFKKEKGGVLTVSDRNVIGQMLNLLKAYDPRRVVERFHLQQTEGKVKIEIDEPLDKSEPIVVTATYLPESPSPGRREVLFVDQATKLATAIEFYHLKNGEYQYTSLMEFRDYNQRIDPEMFTLNNLPADVVRVDQTTQEVGLVQGELSNGEIAVEVARQFLQALIDQDYIKAGKLIGGAPAELVKQQAFGKKKCLRIISIGSAAPHPDPRTGGVIVPCVVEIEKDGEISQWKLDRLGVRPVYNQPGRWMVFGGIDPKNLEPNIPNDNKLIEEHKSPSIEQKSARELSDEEKNQQPMVKEVVRKLFQACSDNDWDKFSKLWPDLELKDFQKNYIGGLEISSIGEPFKKDDSDTWYVPYEIKLKVGEVRKKDLRVHYDESTAEFKACGGL